LLGSLSGYAFQITNSDQVAVSDCANIGRAEGDEGLGLARRENKLDLKTVGRVNVDNCAQIPTTQAMLGKVPIQNYCVEQVEHDWPGCAVMK
jgi:hypothetical protein